MVRGRLPVSLMAKGGDFMVSVPVWPFNNSCPTLLQVCTRQGGEGERGTMRGDYLTGCALARDSKGPPLADPKSVKVPRGSFPQL